MVECYFCGNQVETIEEAIELHWIPSFFDGDSEVSEPCCPECCKKNLRIGEDGELELNPHRFFAESSND